MKLLTSFLNDGSCLVFQSRERVVRVLRAMNAGDAVDQVLRQVDKLIRNAERASRDARLMKVNPL